MRAVENATGFLDVGFNARTTSQLDQRFCPKPARGMAAATSAGGGLNRVEHAERRFDIERARFSSILEESDAKHAIHLSNTLAERDTQHARDLSDIRLNMARDAEHAQKHSDLQVRMTCRLFSSVVVSTGR